jgi:hypothetical protein
MFPSLLAAPIISFTATPVGGELHFNATSNGNISFPVFQTDAITNSGYIQIEFKTLAPFVSDPKVQPIWSTISSTNGNIGFFTVTNDRVRLVDNIGGTAYAICGINLFDGEWHTIKLRKDASTILTIDGYVLNSGQTFSFNRLGNITFSDLFPMAVAYRNFKIIPDGSSSFTIDCPMNDGSSNILANNGTGANLTINGTEGVDWFWFTP